MDRLEAEEKARVQKLKRQVLPENIPDPIGLDDTKKFSLNNDQQASTDFLGSTAALYGPLISTNSNVQQLFWEKYEMQHQQAMERHRRPNRDEQGTSELRHQEQPSSIGILPYGRRRRYNFRAHGPLPTGMEVPDSIVTQQTTPRLTTVAFPGELYSNKVSMANPTNAAKLSSAVASSSNSASPGSIGGRTVETPPPSTGAKNKSSTSMMSFSPDEDTTFDDDDDDEDMVDD